MTDAIIIGSRFRITDTIGEGGMGDVYRGVDEHTGETVAIKRLKSDIVQSNPSLIERFTREGEALRRLNHPNIVKMLAAIEENGLHYLVMQYVGGGSLRDLLDRQPKLPIDQVLALGIELADALTRAHHLKIIHRDLKPENVLIDENGTPLLTDFGVARIGTRTRVTETGSVIGTYAYLSPEACMGEELDARTDIWSFGVILYEMLAGERPFEASQATAVLLAIMQKPLPPLDEFRPDVPPSLSDLISRMLEKDLNQRVPSVRLVGAALEAIQQNDKTPLPAPLLDRSSKPQHSRFSTPTPAQSEITLPAAETPALANMDPIVITMPTPAPTAAIPSPVPASPARAGKIAWAAGAAAVMVIIALLLVVLGVFEGRENNGGGENQTPLKVEPVGPNEYMVLIAEPEALQQTPERNLGTSIAESLKQTLERDVPFSSVRIRVYPRVIHSEAEARAAAEANGAVVIVWGNYTSDLIELEIQIGVTTGFKHIAFDRETLERTTNVRVHLTDERRQSVALHVMGVINALWTADGSGYEVARNLAIISTISVVPAEIVSGGVASHLQNAASLYYDNTAQAIAEYDAALALDPGSAMAYVYRSAAYLRSGDLEKSQRDIVTAQRLGPEGWTMPLYMNVTYFATADDPVSAAEYFDKIVALRPEDWFAYSYRGILYYLLGQYDQALADSRQAIALGPTANFPYVISGIIALREGQLDQLHQDFTTVLTQFPDPALSLRLIEAIYGDAVPYVFGPLLSAAGNLLLGQYEQAIADTEEALAINDQMTDLYLLQGMAYCNLRDYAAAEAAYTQGIALEPTYTALYALRSEVLIRQGNRLGAMQDGNEVQRSALASQFGPLLDAGLRGEWTCEQFVTFDYATLRPPNGQPPGPRPN